MLTELWVWFYTTFHIPKRRMPIRQRTLSYNLFLSISSKVERNAVSDKKKKDRVIIGPPEDAAPPPETFSDQPASPSYGLAMTPENAPKNMYHDIFDREAIGDDMGPSRLENVPEDSLALS